MEGLQDYRTSASRFQSFHQFFKFDVLVPGPVLVLDVRVPEFSKIDDLGQRRPKSRPGRPRPKKTNCPEKILFWA